MENSIADTDRENVWQVMSEFFVDNEIDYDYWAEKIAQFPIEELKDIFFREVAPVCGPNVLTPVPPAWLTFDTEWVVDEIKRNLSKRESSLIYRARYDANVICYRIRCREFWSDVEDAIIRIRAKRHIAEKPTQP
ncbi:hypothetical protein GXB81_22210 [Paraburkholderia sp. Ac-20336]|uniref:DUF7079 family protein n=1 Tax=Paraburkholderia sp. Ac-20336 TaxID=2703886 RepID=UPI00197E25FB|nr:hypothetical protein [Paraburkholderia sp. Ac-20336]MBN3805745.1 hypothetical protein [Paraburkholderia sp. Ac-20336]